MSSALSFEVDLDGSDDMGKLYSQLRSRILLKEDITPPECGEIQVMNFIAAIAPALLSYLPKSDKLLGDVQYQPGGLYETYSLN